jgi:hypothetical protein
MTDENTEAPKPAKRRGRPPGLPRTPGSGRKKGVPNKINGSIHDVMKALGCDPRMVLARICMNAKNPAELRRKAASDLMGFMYPRLASTEQHVTGETQTIVQIISGIARLPTDDPIDVTPALPAPDNNGAPSASDSVTTSPALAAPVAYSEVFEAKDLSQSALPPARPWHPSAPSMDAPRPPSPASDRLHDDNLSRKRDADSKVAELNSQIRSVDCVTP